MVGFSRANAGRVVGIVLVGIGMLLTQGCRAGGRTETVVGVSQPDPPHTRAVDVPQAHADAMNETGVAVPRPTPAQAMTFDTPQALAEEWLAAVAVSDPGRAMHCFINAKDAEVVSRQLKSGAREGEDAAELAEGLARCVNPRKQMALFRRFWQRTRASNVSLAGARVVRIKAKEEEVAGVPFCEPHVEIEVAGKSYTFWLDDCLKGPRGWVMLEEPEWGRAGSLDADE